MKDRGKTQKKIGKSSQNGAHELPAVTKPQNTLNEIEITVLKEISDPKFLDKAFVVREQAIYKSLALLEKFIKNNLRSFLCGDFLVFDRKQLRLTSVAKYPVTGYDPNYERTEASFFRDGTTQDIEKKHRDKLDLLAKKELLFSTFVRKSPAEKQVSLVLIQTQKGNTRALEKFKKSFEQDLSRLGLQEASWIKCTDIVEPAKFSERGLLPRWLTRSLSPQARLDAEREFAKIDRVIQLSRSSVPAFRNNHEEKYRKLDEYFEGLNSYYDYNVLQDGYVMVYCPAVFAADEPPANFWGMFSAKILSEKYEEERFLQNIIYMETCLSTIVSQVVGMLAKKSEADLRTHATRAAVGAIMSRNMSHNIGSHVSPRATLERIGKRLLDFTDTQGLDEGAKHHVEIRLKTQLDEFIQKKADFLAEITTEPLATTKPAFFYREVIVPFIQNSLLMDNLAANEDVNFAAPNGQQNRLTIRVFYNDQEISGLFSCQHANSEQYYYPPRLPYSLLCSCSTDKGPINEDLIFERCGSFDDSGGFHNADVEIELPGPLGEYAMFGLLENYIRNVAKHNREVFSDQNSLELQIDLFEPDSATERLEYYSFRITDNLSRNRELASSEDQPAWTLKDQIEKYLTSDIIENDGFLKREAWGLAEMKICASLLRGSSDFSGIAESLRVELHKGRIAFTGKLMKSKKICVVAPVVNQIQRERLKEQGVWVFADIDELDEYFSNDSHLLSPVSFRFAFIDMGTRRHDDKLISTLKKLMQELPFRIVLRAKGNLVKDIERALGAHKTVITEESLDLTASADHLYQTCWEIWVRGRFSETNAPGAQLHVYLQQPAGQQPTQQWSDHGQSFNSGNKFLNLVVWRQEQGPDVTTIKKNVHHLIYDRHGDVLKWRVPAIEMDNFPDAHYYNVLDKASSDFTLLFSPPFPPTITSPWPLPWEIAEAALLRVVVVDERIAERAFDIISHRNLVSLRLRLGSKFKDSLPKGDAQSVRRFHLAWASRVFIATHRVSRISEYEHRSLHRSTDRLESMPKLVIDLDGGITTVKHYPSANAALELIKAEMLIIHQGVLDQVVEDLLEKDSGARDMDRRKKEVLREVVAGLEREFPFVIINSGRGIPHSLPGDQKFLPFSIVQDYLLGQRIAKYCLARVALPLRRRRTKEKE